MRPDGVERIPSRAFDVAAQLLSHIETAGVEIRYGADDGRIETAYVCRPGRDEGLPIPGLVLLAEHPADGIRRRLLHRVVNRPDLGCLRRVQAGCQLRSFPQTRDRPEIIPVMGLALVTQV